MQIYRKGPWSCKQELALVRLRSHFVRAAPDTTLRPRSTRGCATRSPQGEAWWARQDSNLQPDRYERPALTIELQAPPRGSSRERGRQRCAVRLQGWRRGCNVGCGGWERRGSITDGFEITEIGDDACIPLFCPTKQNQLLEARFSGPLTH